MPAMLRPSKLAKKIAYAIIGMPVNMKGHDKNSNKLRAYFQKKYEAR